MKGARSSVSAAAVCALILMALPGASLAGDLAPEPVPVPEPASVAEPESVPEPAFVPEPRPGVTVVTEVKVERLRPRKPKLEMLRFLNANRDFIRSRFDALRIKKLERSGAGVEMDPRFLRYPEMLADVYADRDSVRARDDAWKRRELMASITELGGLEEQLDALEHLLAEQRTRLGMLQEDFTGDQRTALIVVVSGEPAGTGLTEVVVALEDGSRLTVPIHPAEREALAAGGVVQVFHGFVEPREQVVEVAIAGESWPSGDRGFVTLEPVRDRLMLLRLDFTRVDATQGTAGIQASTWLHETKLPIGG